jgi:3-hydroxybutyryl-CoA dehydratase
VRKRINVHRGKLASQRSIPGRCGGTTARQKGSRVMQELHGYFIEDLEVGMSDSYGKTVTDADIVAFAGVSGDTNPVHLNEEFAKETLFKGRIAHGMLAASFLSTVLGTRLPGPGAIYMGQTLNFRAPVKVGDTVIARVEVTDVDHDKRRIKVETTCKVGETVVVDGEAKLMVNSRAQLAANQATQAAE